MTKSFRVVLGRGLLVKEESGCFPAVARDNPSNPLTFPNPVGRLTGTLADYTSWPTRPRGPMTQAAKAL